MNCGNTRKQRKAKLRNLGSHPQNMFPKDSFSAQSLCDLSHCGYSSCRMIFLLLKKKKKKVNE